MKLSWHAGLVGCILGFTLVFSLFLASKESLTTDEDIHVSSAYLALTRHEFRFDPEHPFLFKYLTALPLLALNLNMPADDQKLWEAGKPTVFDSWEAARSWSDQWFFTSGNDADQMTFLSRIPGVLSFVGLCALVYYLGRRWFSPTIGLFALIFTAFNPNLIAHGHFTNTDTPNALVFLLTIWALWAYYEKPNFRQSTVLGFTLGIALTVKFSTIILIPITFAWLLYTAVKKNTGRQFLAHLGIVIFLSLAVIWIVYQLPFSLINGTAFTINGSHQLPAKVPISQTVFDKVLLLRFIAPIDWIKGLLLVLGGSYVGRPTYFMGETHWGIWYYFPLLYILKTQIIALFVLTSGLVLLLNQPFEKLRKWQPLTVLLVGSAGILIIISITSKLNIGIRHIMPLMPFISLALALSLHKMAAKWRTPWLPAVVFVAYIFPMAFNYPNYLGYVNIFIQPSTNTYLYFNDSNLDWGQQAKEITKTVREDFPTKKMYSNYQWNPYILPYYGLESSSFDPKNPPTDGIFIVTATQLSYPEYYIFRTEKPIKTLENHTFFYRLQE